MSTTYRGPNVSVRQEFQATPPATAIEDLPSVAIATAYNVYKKEPLGDVSGIYPTQTLSWPN